MKSVTIKTDNKAHFINKHINITFQLWHEKGAEVHWKISIIWSMTYFMPERYLYIGATKEIEEKKYICGIKKLCEPLSCNCAFFPFLPLIYNKRCFPTNWKVASYKIVITLMHNGTHTWSFVTQGNWHSSGLALLSSYSVRVSKLTSR